MLLIVLLIILCAIIFVWSWMKPRLPSPPTYPGALPLLGHAYLFTGDATHNWKVERDLYNYCLEAGDIVSIKLGPQSFYVITDPDDSLKVSNTCFNKPYMYSFAKEMYDSGLITANGLKWKVHRKLLNPVFSMQVLHTFMDVFNTQAKSLVLKLASEADTGPFDVQQYMITNALATFCQTSLGLHPEEQSELIKNYAHSTRSLFALYAYRLQNVWLHLSCIFNMSSYKKKQDALMKILKDITKKVIYKRKAELKARSNLHDHYAPSSGNFGLILDQILDLADKQGDFTDKEISDHLNTFVAAAYNSSTTTMTFTLILIGSHQDVQNKIYLELQEVLGNGDRDINRHDLTKLVYLEAVIKETLRLYPPAPRIARISESKIKLKNFTLPANSIYVVSLYAINRHPMWGADADQFKPERWLNPNSLPAIPNAFASFSIGKRSCIGKLYSMMVLKTTLAHILRQYCVTANINNMTLKCDLVLTPVTGHQISLEIRK